MRNTAVELSDIERYLGKCGRQGPLDKTGGSEELAFGPVVVLATNLSSTITSAVGSQIATKSYTVNIFQSRTGSCCHYNIMYLYYAWMMIGNTVLPDKPAVSSAMLPFIW